MKENWGKVGFPPASVDVKHSYTTYDTDTVNGYHIHKQRYWIGGYHAHWGKPLQGWTGQETEIIKEIKTTPEKKVYILYEKTN